MITTCRRDHRVNIRMCKVQVLDIPDPSPDFKRTGWQMVLVFSPNFTTASLVYQWPGDLGSRRNMFIYTRGRRFQLR